MADEEALTELRLVFAERLRAARQRSGLTQPDLARKAGHGVTRHIIANCEAARTLPSLVVYVALCAALGVDAGPLTRTPNCPACGEAPPAGFRCNACGRGAVREIDHSAGGGMLLPKRSSK